jgi:hypothetical protein
MPKVKKYATRLTDWREDGPFSLSWKSLHNVQSQYPLGKTNVNHLKIECGIAAIAAHTAVQQGCLHVTAGAHAIMKY